MKRWYRASKTRTIMARNPDWGDLYQELIDTREVLTSALAVFPAPPPHP